MQNTVTVPNAADLLVRIEAYLEAAPSVSAGAFSLAVGSDHKLVAKLRDGGHNLMLSTARRIDEELVKGWKRLEFEKTLAEQFPQGAA